MVEVNAALWTAALLRPVALGFIAAESYSSYLRDGGKKESSTVPSFNFQTAGLGMGTQPEFCSVNLYATRFWCFLRAVRKTVLLRTCNGKVF